MCIYACMHVCMYVCMHVGLVWCVAVCIFWYADFGIFLRAKTHIKYLKCPFCLRVCDRVTWVTESLAFVRSTASALSGGLATSFCFLDGGLTTWTENKKTNVTTNIKRIYQISWPDLNLPSWTHPVVAWQGFQFKQGKKQDTPIISLPPSYAEAVSSKEFPVATAEIWGLLQVSNRQI
jgi:hypothetical protein